MLLHVCIQFFLQFFSAFSPNQQSQSMDEIKLNASAEIDNKQNYLPSYFLVNLVLEITWAKNNSLRTIVNKFKDKIERTYLDYLFHLL